MLDSEWEHSDLLPAGKTIFSDGQEGDWTGKDSPGTPWKKGSMIPGYHHIWDKDILTNLETTDNRNNCDLQWGTATRVHLEDQFNKKVVKTGLLTMNYFWVCLITQETFSAKYPWKYTSTWGNKTYRTEHVWIFFPPNFSLKLLSLQKQGVISI